MSEDVTTGEPTYFRPPNADTGEPTLAVYFSAELFPLMRAYEYDVAAKTDQLAADVRDHLDRLGIAIRPTIRHGRLRAMQDIEPDENGVNRDPMVVSTVVAYLTDAEPDDPRLVPLLENSFHGQRIDAQIEFEIPTTASEAALAEQEKADAERAAEYRVKADAARAEAADREARPFDQDMSELFD
ncbi:MULTISPECIES: hypothetical protein [Mycobacteriaceae]|uniref:Uncharacterized protein n=3 Tax=Mycobacteriaceae TaxID=1762 RepID=A0A1Y0C5T7_9MYCO|nr:MULTISPECIES: hypothetical protein [Mycobacteriaceae]ART70492.1 hypothetical protein BTO20_19670 [Mycobacterium dioxanotrophicus]KLI09221.1 hypothetical protein AA982_03660 [Mycolicibacterium senegalense]KLO47614.1 hypothetical protein ABW05_30680 [Mycolicibacterium senegalense]UBV13062.1 hypothetical protein H8Z57_19525 [Mycolicibacterium fortuitum]